MGFSSSGPTRREKEMFIFGIAAGAMLSVIGTFAVTSSFRLYDQGFSHDNILFLVSSMVLFVIVFLSIPGIVKKL